MLVQAFASWRRDDHRKPTETPDWCSKELGDKRLYMKVGVLLDSLWIHPSIHSAIYLLGTYYMISIVNKTQKLLP